MKTSPGFQKGTSPGLQTKICPGLLPRHTAGSLTRRAAGRLLAAVALVFLAAAPVRAQGPDVESVTQDGGRELRVEAGGSATFTIQGRNLELLEGAAVHLNRRSSRYFRVELAPPERRRSRGGMRARTLTVTASRDAEPGSGYTLRLEAPKYRFARTVAKLEVSAPASSGKAGGSGRRSSGDQASQRAREMVKERASAADVAREMRRAFRRTAGQTASILKEVEFDGAAIASALTAGLRASPRAVASSMREAGFATKATARALQEGLSLSTRELAKTLRDGLRLTREDSEETLRSVGADRRQIEDALEYAGYVPPAPGVQRYWIRDYRPGAGSGSIIENEGIVDRFMVAVSMGVEPETTDGHVWIEGTSLDRPDTEVFANAFGGDPLRGEILERTSGGGLDRLRVRFDRVPGPGLMVRHSGGEVVHDARRLGYYMARREVVEEPLQDLDLRLGSPEGEVQIAVAGLNATLELPPHRESGIETILTDIRNDGFSVETAPAPNGCALVLTIPFRETGREFRGTFAAYVPVWKCADFEVPRAECGFLDIPCFLNYLGTSLASLGATCGNLAAWQEEEVLDLPGAPFEGDLHDAAVEVRMELTADGSGRLAGQNTSYAFDSDISIVGPLGGDIPLSAIEGYLTGEVTQVLNATMQNVDLSDLLADAVNNAVDGAESASGFSLHIRGIYPDPQGGPRLFLDLEL